MAAQIKFYGGDHGVYDVDSNGSGIGFYGPSDFGSSVAVNDWQDYTYITDPNGTVRGSQLSNWKWMHANSGQYERGSTYALSGIPNSYATLNVRFTNDTAVKCQNVKFRAYDRVNINNDPSGVTVRIAEIARPNSLFGSSLTNSGPFGSGSVWTTVNGSGSIYTFRAQSPGSSGVGCLNPNYTDSRHDWYMLLSLRPNSIGQKTNVGGYISLEYL
jgi:hypothetical protein